jgi:hypothetical protein
MVRRPGLRRRSTEVHEVHKMRAAHPPMKGADWSARTIFLDYNLERSSWFRRSATILLQLGDALRHSASGCHGWPLRELKLKLWWMKTCEASSYAAYETRGIHFAHLQRWRWSVESWRRWGSLSNPCWWREQFQVVLGWAAQRKRESRWRARPGGEYGPRGFWKILKTCLFLILIQIQIRFEFWMSSTRTLN